MNQTPNQRLEDHIRKSGNFHLTEEARVKILKNLHARLSARPDLPEIVMPTANWLSRIPRPAYAATLFMFLVIGSLVLGIAANASKPGDALYPIDRALEQVRLSLTVGTSAKSTYRVNLLEERAHELDELQTSVNTKTAVQVNEAQDRAADEIRHAEDQLKQVEEKTTKDASKKIKDKFEAAKNRIEKAREKIADKLKDSDQDNDTPSSSTTAITSLSVTVINGRAQVTIKFNGQTEQYSFDTTDTEEIIKELHDRTGLSESKLRAKIKITNSNRTIKMPVSIMDFDRIESQVESEASGRNGASAESSVDVETRVNSSDRSDYSEKE